jgi:hypothetical protein
LALTQVKHLLAEEEEEEEDGRRRRRYRIEKQRDAKGQKGAT